MIEKFKKFAEIINSYRLKRNRLKVELPVLLKKYNVINVLEVGCNLRPLCDQKLREQYSLKLHGIDPDDSINKNIAKEKFDYFEISNLESYDTENKYDLILLNMVMEHIEDNDSSFKKLKGLLSNKGVIVSWQPSNLHPFSVLNQLLPHDFKEKILRIFLPWSNPGARGWRSYYHKCNYLGFRNLCRENDLVIKKAKFNYNASHYFSFFPPLFLLIVLYEEIVRLLGIKLLCSDFWVEISHDNKNG
jgi:2-polyprenyl-3-methyl-5-hydroxy-6-metoxy-1,4-benzoquinol methylase